MIRRDRDDDPTMRSGMIAGDNDDDLGMKLMTMIADDSDDDSGDDSDDDIDSDDDPTMTTSMLRSGVIAGDNGSPKLLTLGPAQPPELENTNFVGMKRNILWMF